jgi:uncharacterized membrane protein YidH (DUF202 family)
MTGHAPRFDPGLQPERTALAWLRTGLAVGVGALVGGRLLAPTSGAAAVAASVLGLALAALFLVGATRRARRTQAALARDRHLATGPDGRLLAIVCVTCTATGVAALALVVGMRLALGR